MKLEKEDSKFEKEDFKKNSRINKFLEENSDLQKSLTKYKEDGGSVVNALILVSVHVGAGGRMIGKSRRM